MSGALLVRALRDPTMTSELDAAGWTGLITSARAEQILGTLAHRLHGLPMPATVERILADARAAAEQGRTLALWEAEMASQALLPLGIPVVLLKGTAYVAAGLSAGQGRSIGDLDILVPRDALDAVEAALLAAGWEWVKPDAYDDAYYRRWMHELPPLIHRERDRMIDVHHTILPLTARPTPDAGALLANSVPLSNGLRVLSHEDMVCHAVAHLFADGDLSGGIRNLWDLHCLLEAFEAPMALASLRARASLHGIAPHLERALRLRGVLYEDGARLTASDRFFVRRLLARDDWGRPTAKATQTAFYLRSHLLRMPPGMLARHLWTKWRKGHRGTP
ncbi:nucleotidyltransferase family protein [Sphingomonas sp. PL-96]|uniref:nucleotidyltransferase domain-containing protein n=1 Tax=Sphingomonas sp. PL-96 TaxID=2887201 RepID=UPI001E61EE50|nr:nucleotidyltransferase family protein [Sphingomonas sp. PL-96]MCC2975499.1 nucleotidyltransferase family protein [Sphingomonas sp. PL-96]